jgi:hypothetical protein
VACGENDPSLLEFDHIDPSIKSFLLCRKVGRSDMTYFHEVAKTQFLCVNCHMDKSFPGSPRKCATPKSMRRAIDYNRQRKRQVGECIDCHLRVSSDGTCGFSKFQWDHRERLWELPQEAHRNSIELSTMHR